METKLEQVFGNNPLLWFCPLPIESGKPVGDGLNWKIKEEQRVATLRVMKIKKIIEKKLNNQLKSN